MTSSCSSNGLTEADVEARVDRKLEETNKILAQQSQKMSDLKELMKVLIARGSTS